VKILNLSQKSHIAEFKQLVGFQAETETQAAGDKNAGFTHYVIENTCRNNVGFRLYQYVYENKPVIVS
jgi:hypothetical protein